MNAPLDEVTKTNINVYSYKEKTSKSENMRITRIVNTEVQIDRLLRPIDSYLTAQKIAEAIDEFIFIQLELAMGSSSPAKLGRNAAATGDLDTAAALANTTLRANKSLFNLFSSCLWPKVEESFERFEQDLESFNKEISYRLQSFITQESRKMNSENYNSIEKICGLLHLIRKHPLGLKISKEAFTQRLINAIERESEVLLSLPLTFDNPLNVKVLESAVNTYVEKLEPCFKLVYGNYKPRLMSVLIVLQDSYGEINLRLKNLKNDIGKMILFSYHGEEMLQLKNQRRTVNKTILEIKSERKQCCDPKFIEKHGKKKIRTKLRELKKEEKALRDRLKTLDFKLEELNISSQESYGTERQLLEQKKTVKRCIKRLNSLEDSSKNRDKQMQLAMGKNSENPEKLT